jgi:hypothetical protein
VRRRALIPILALGLLLAAAAPSAAITGGTADGTDHPYEALLLIPGAGFCSGTLIDPDVILTAGHCTFAFEEIGQTVMVSFAPQAEVDADWFPVNPADWHPASTWTTHPLYDNDAWPFTYDYGLLYLDDPVTDITPANLPSVGLIDELVGPNGQTQQRFVDVGYGQNGVTNGGGTPQARFTWTRKEAVQRYRPGNGSTSGILHPTWFIVGNVPSSQHGSACGGDSGSGLFPYASGALGDTLLAVHTGGYNLGFEGNICGRITSLNHRVDIPEVLDWIAADPNVG